RGNEYRVLDLSRSVADSATVAKNAAGAKSATGAGTAPMKEESERKKLERLLSQDEIEAIQASETHKRAMERVPGHRETMRALFGERMPRESGYVPLSQRGGQ